MPHDDGGDEQDGRVERMQPGKPVEHSLAVLVAELIARDERNEQEPEKNRDHEYPEQRVAVVGAGRGHIHDVAGAEPGQDDDDARAEGAEILEKRVWDWRGGGEHR